MEERGASCAGHPRVQHVHGTVGDVAECRQGRFSCGVLGQLLGRARALEGLAVGRRHHLEARVRGAVGRNAIEFDVVKELVEEHHGALVDRLSAGHQVQVAHRRWNSSGTTKQVSRRRGSMSLAARGHAEMKEEEEEAQE